MQKIQILFPEPQLKKLRALAKSEDRPVSEIIRRAVDRDLEQRGSPLGPENARPPVFPIFDGGAILVEADQMKVLIHADDIQ